MITKKFLIIEKLFCKIINYKKMHKEKDDEIYQLF